MAKQNRSHAVMAQRNLTLSDPDNFPTPPWATRALMEKILKKLFKIKQNCLEPACGQGHMAKALEEYFENVIAFDKYDYDFGHQQDFLINDLNDGQFDWVITNPPFKLAEEFIFEGLRVASIGVGMLVRTSFIESVGRYDRIFKKKPPSILAQFSERVPMIKGRLDPKATTATSYAWLLWLKKEEYKSTQLRWIPPCRKTLEKEFDYTEDINLNQ